MKKSMVAMASALALASGCASWHPMAKAAVTPVAVVRDSLDMVLMPVADVSYHVGMTSFENMKESSPVSSRGGGISINVTAPVYLALSGGVGTADYLACRSLVGSLKGENPWRKHFYHLGEEPQPLGERFFPNLKELYPSLK